MTTAVLSDPHLGARSSLLADAGTLAQLTAVLAGVDRLVLLGDTLDLRHAPAPAVVEAGRPVLDELRAAVPELILVPGNHDHRLAGPILDARGTLEVEQVAAGGPLLPDVRVAYPGLWLRPDVYATHGHYLDCHLRVPRPEVILAHATQLAVGRIPRQATPDRYEAALAPIYRLAYRLAQRGRRVRETGWRRVAAGEWLGRASLAAFEQVVRRLGIDAAHVLFGHTHRPIVAGRLVNVGSWVRPQADAYRPGTVVFVRETGPPELRYVLPMR